MAAYGTYDYQMIFNANRNIIGANPNGLEEGTILHIPCEDGRLTKDSIGLEEKVAQDEEKYGNLGVPTSYEPPLKLVTGGGWEPFAGEKLSGQGFMVRLATTSLHRGENNRDYKVSFVNDWGSHTETLLPSGAFDVSIAWYIPDCTKLELLSEASVRRCTELDFTVPVYESVIGYFSVPGNKFANAQKFSDYEGARVCRLEGTFTHDLEEEGLAPPKIEMVHPQTATACFEALMNGTADVAGMEMETAQGAMNKMGLTYKEVVQNPNLSKLLTMRFVTHKANPRGRVYIAMLNRGLNEMRESGEWYDIVAAGLAEYHNLTQTN